MRRLLSVGILAFAAAGVVLADEPAPVAAPTPGPEQVIAEHLPNAYRLHERVISGGQPDGAAAFRELQALGVKTVISVDGAQPDVATAAQFGLRYVHLPHGYDGISPERAAELAKAVRDLPGRVYIHCHHGKHRSPAAATVACVATGLLRPDDALSVLQTAGTSRNYRGLYEAALAARRIDDQTLDALQVEFPETAELPAMAEAMVRIEQAHDHLQQFAAAGWKSLADTPDLDPAHEALLLREQFTELLRTPAVMEQTDEFRRLVQQSETAAASLETQLRAGQHAAASESLTQITGQCAACHRDDRDVPLSEKGGTFAK